VQDTASGHSQVDGSTTPNPLAAGDARDLVSRTVRTILVDNDFSALDSYLAGEDYVQHNPHFGDGISGLAVALAQQGITMTYDEITHVVAEGDFAHTRSVGSFASTLYVFHDLFRVADGRAAEHSDVMVPR
jgi:predicted SnoaL-like aldol condensation-catalyzing enzyme